MRVTPNKEKARSILKMVDTTLEMINQIDKRRFPSNVAKEYYEAIRELIEENIIEIEHTKPKELAKIRKDFNIQEGEASSLALAMKEKGILATDDKPTMKACTILDIDFSTAVHFVVRAYNRRLIDKKIALEKLSGLEKYGRYSARIMEDAMHRIEGD